MLRFLAQHPVMVSAVGTWLLNNVVSALISSLPAPTKDSSMQYVYWFKVLNTIIGNVKRAQSTALEQSPNWEDAIQKHLAKVNGGSATSLQQ